MQNLVTFVRCLILSRYCGEELKGICCCGLQQETGSLKIKSCGTSHEDNDLLLDLSVEKNWKGQTIKYTLILRLFLPLV